MNRNQFNASPLTNTRFGDRYAVDVGLRDHMNRVYATMSGGLLITMAAAWAISGLAVDSLGHLTQLGQTLFLSPLKWVVIFAPLAMVLFMGILSHKLSSAALNLMFYSYAALMGVSLSTIFLAYTGASIAQTFFVTAGAFAGLSIVGYTTKKDLSGIGSFLIMGLFGLILATIVNLFLKSSAMDFALSVIGVLIFAGLTVYDTQKIKGDYLEARTSGEQSLGKIATLAALNLYLDFINLFMFLLRFMGNNRN